MAASATEPQDPNPMTGVPFSSQFSSQQTAQWIAGNWNPEDSDLVSRVATSIDGNASGKELLALSEEKLTQLLGVPPLKAPYLYKLIHGDSEQATPSWLQGLISISEKEQEKRRAVLGNVMTRTQAMAVMEDNRDFKMMSLSKMLVRFRIELRDDFPDRLCEGITNCLDDNESRAQKKLSRDFCGNSSHYIESARVFVEQSREDMDVDMDDAEPMELDIEARDTSNTPDKYGIIPCDLGGVPIVWFELKKRGSVKAGGRCQCWRNAYHGTTEGGRSHAFAFLIRGKQTVQLCCSTYKNETVQFWMSEEIDQTSGPHVVANLFYSIVTASKKSLGFHDDLPEYVLVNPLGTGAEKYVFSAAPRNVDDRQLVVAKFWKDKKAYLEAKQGHAFLEEHGISYENSNTHCFDMPRPNEWNDDRLCAIFDRKFSLAASLIPGEGWTQLAASLNKFHALKKVHCDVSRSNILVDFVRQRPCLTDCGRYYDEMAPRALVEQRPSIMTSRDAYPLEFVAGEGLNRGVDQIMFLRAIQMSLGVGGEGHWLEEQQRLEPEAFQLTAGNIFRASAELRSQQFSESTSVAKQGIQLPQREEVSDRPSTVKSKNHEHELLRMLCAKDGYNYTCDMCNKPLLDIRFSCLLCGWDECDRCSREPREPRKPQRHRRHAARG